MVAATAFLLSFWHIAKLRQDERTLLIILWSIGLIIQEVMKSS